MIDWSQRVVLVTGGSSGLGLSIAQAWAKRRARVAITARDAAKLDVAVQSIDGEVLSVPGDVTRQPDVDRIIADVIARWGRLDVLVNCVGRSTRGEVLSTSPEEFQALWETNFLSVVRCTRAAAAHLQQSGGSIVNIGSLASKSASRFLGAYPASKFAVAAYSQQLRLELGPRGIHVLLVCPGPIARSDGNERYQTVAKGLPAAAQQPGAGVRLRAIKPDDLAERIIHACQRRRSEIVLPWKARILFAISQLSPRWGDWLLKKNTRES